MIIETTGGWARILHCKNKCGWFANHILLEHLQVCPDCGSYTTFSVGRINYKVIKWFGFIIREDINDIEFK